MIGAILISVIEQAVPRVFRFVDSQLDAQEKVNTGPVSIPRRTADDQAELKRTIQESTLSLGQLVRSGVDETIDAIRRNRILGAMDDLRARVTLMNDLLRETNIDLQVTERLVSQVLTPLRESVIKTGHILEESNDQDLIASCRIVGLTALVAGYEYLGQGDKTSLKSDLRQELLSLQKRMLSRYARGCLEKGEEFPWEDVPHLLEVTQAKMLAEKYVMAERTVESYVVEDDDFEPSKMTVAEAKQFVAEITNFKVLESFIAWEYMCGNKGTMGGRASVLNVCFDKWNELGNAGDDDN